jgi:tetratricopeptide (TPR) repeat protein
LGDAGKIDDALQAEREVIELYQELCTRLPDSPALQRSLVENWTKLGSLLNESEAYQEAEGALRNAIELQEDLVRDFPDSLEWMQELASSYHLLGETLGKALRVEEAVKAYRTASEIREKLVADAPESIQYRIRLVYAYRRLGDALKNMGRGDEAVEVYRKAVEPLEGLAAAASSHADQARVALSLQHFAFLFLRAGDSELAERLAHKGVELRRELVAVAPRSPQYQAGLAWTSHVLGNVLASRRRLPKAEDAYREAIRLWEGAVAENPTEYEWQDRLRCFQFDGHSNCLILSVRIEQRRSLSCRGRRAVRSVESTVRS